MRLLSGVKRGVAVVAAVLVSYVLGAPQPFGWVRERAPTPPPLVVTASVRGTPECAVEVTMENRSDKPLRRAEVEILEYERGFSDPIARSTPRQEWTRIVEPRGRESECWTLAIIRDAKGPSLVTAKVLSAEFYEKGESIPR